jgi:hypothetical protein
LLLAACWLLSGLPVLATVYYVNAANPAPAPPFNSWDTAATNIQDAINLTSTNDTVLVTNGVYAFGGLAMEGGLTNRVALTNAITVQSVNGPWVTTILGAGAINGPAAVRCAWLTNGATLSGFTLTAGASQTSGDAALESGGGVWCATSSALVANCVIVSNTAYESGGGIYQGTLMNSLVSSNGCRSAVGGASYQSVLNNCTIVSNTAVGAAQPLAMTNCIIYFNGQGENYSVSGSAFSRCCTTPALAGTGNFTNEPQLLADGVHVADTSACIGAGIGPAAGTDVFGKAWANPPSVGCAEWFPAPLVVTPPATAFPATGGIAIGAAVAGQSPFTCRWTKNGLPVQSDANHIFVNSPTLLINNFALSDAGSYQMVVSNSFGLATSVVSQVSVHCVAAGGTAQSPYSDWTSAATNIQDAINAAQTGDVVLVTNGLYAFGGMIMDGMQSNRVALTGAIMVQSVNGPWATTILGGNRTNGAPATRCAWLTNGAALVGFTLEGAATLNLLEYGGGVWCASSNALVANCIISSNIAGMGGGAYSGTLRNCAIFANNGQYGGGTARGFLNNCTVTANAATLFGGGIYYPLAQTNCIVYYNSNSGAANIYGPGPASYCCTYPMPSGGVGNFTNAPQLFVDNVHLLINSPCIGAGTNLGASTDIAGRPWNNPPSIGCSEATLAPLVGSPVIQLTNNPPGFVITAAITGAGQLSSWWLENGIPLQNHGQFSSTQSASLIATGVSLTDAGGFQLVVSNSFGVVTSAVAQVVMHCVDAAGTNPVAPYLSWDTAATNIQDAITAANVGEIVMVTNGIYAQGGISMDGVITNVVSVNRAILVQSVNGAGSTIIQGAWDPVSTNGPGAVRGVWMTTNAILSGFTIQGGATRAVFNGSDLNGGGVFGTASSVVANCVILNNTAASAGGGAYGATLINCTLATNRALGIPGIGGVQPHGGGAYNCGLRNCIITGNYALFAGGGTASAELTNCAVIGNSAGTEAGGVYYGTLVNCTVSQNTSLSTTLDLCGGAYNATLINSIVYGNWEADRAGFSPNYSGCTFIYSCTTPTAPGTGNIATDPQLLADGIHLAATSPCRGAGEESVVSETDIDGQPWNNPPSIGCDEWQPAPIMASQPGFQVGVPSHGLTCTVEVAGASSTYQWTQNGVAIQDNGHFSNSDSAGLTINNFGPGDAGAYQVIATNAFGAVTSSVVQLVIHAVDAAGANPISPFSSWHTAATSIQDAIDASAAGDVVLVTNGVYTNGGMAIDGTLTNRVVLDKPITVISVHGYSVTLIEGAWDPTNKNGPAAVRCAYLADGAVLNGFTLCNGATLAGNLAGGPSDSGGGIYCVSANGQAVNCVLSNNSAIFGGGIANGTLNNSLVILNQAGSEGGGGYSGSLNNCTVVDNTALTLAGGTYYSTVENSIVVANYRVVGFVQQSDNYEPLGLSQYSYSCTSPLPGGASNINATPEFLDNYQLPANSPCVGAGSPADAVGYDLDGEPWNNPPAMGCSEVVQSDLVGPLSVQVVSFSTNLLVNQLGGYTGIITGRAAWVEWAFGDGVTVSNTGASAIHSWTNAGNYTVTLTAFNNDNPAGVSASQLVTVQQPVAPQLTLPVLTTNGIQFQFNGQTNPDNAVQYTVQYATNLIPPVSWQTLGTIYFNHQSTLQISDPAATNATRFYRVLAQ